MGYENANHKSRCKQQILNALALNIINEIFWQTGIRSS